MKLAFMPELKWDFCARSEELHDDRGLAYGVGQAGNDLSGYDMLFVPGGMGTRKRQDTAASSRYWHEDIISPEVVVSEKGTIVVPDTPGIGYQPVESLLDKYTLEKREIRR